MTRLGIGIKLLAAMAVTMLLTGMLTYLLPEVFAIHFISSSTLRIAGMILLFGGLPIKIAFARVPARAFKNGELVTTGVFSFVRHPMYAAWILLFAPGIALLFRSWLMLATALVGYFSFKYLIKEEDEYLTGKFGQAYLDYRSRVDGLFPIKRLRRKP